MISTLRGLLTQKQPPYLVVEVNGVGYELQASMFTFYRLPDVGMDVFLYTHLIVREDAHVLYGFSDTRERALFRTLIKVSNIGPKSALAILSGVEPDHFVRCIHDNDVNTLTRIPGIGKKTAERLLIEMKDRLDDWSNRTEIVMSSSKESSNNLHDAVSALIALGYKPQEASRAVSQIQHAETLSREALIRLALQGMVKGANNNDNNGSPHQSTCEER